MGTNKTLTINMTPQDQENLKKLKEYYQKERLLELKDSTAMKMMLADYVSKLGK